jgi:hypothetical protein
MIWDTKGDVLDREKVAYGVFDLIGDLLQWCSLFIRHTVLSSGLPSAACQQFASLV